VGGEVVITKGVESGERPCVKDESRVSTRKNYVHNFAGSKISSRVVVRIGRPTAIPTPELRYRPGAWQPLAQSGNAPLRRIHLPLFIKPTCGLDNEMSAPTKRRCWIR
jgi:hypothetical protein